MYTDPTYREYLLGVAGPEIEADIEEAILAGRVDPERLYEIEDELIDDLLFDRLSAQERRVVHGHFLSDPRRAAKLEFSRALQSYAARHRPRASRLSVLETLRDWMGPGWLLPLTGAVACLLLATIALTVHNVILYRELDSVSRTSDERQRTIASLQQRPEPMPTASAATEPATIELASGVTRGISTVPVLHLAKDASAAVLILELPFKPSGSLREVLLDFNGRQVWSQQFTNAAGIPVNGLVTVTLPAGLLPSGDYTLRAEVDGSRSNAANAASYFFRVRKD